MNFMDIKQISPDQVVFFQYHFITLNLTILFTWGVMALLVIGSWFITRHLFTDRKITPWQNILEILVTGIQDQISEISRQKANRYIPFIGTLFVFIAACNLLTVVPGYESPTASLSTTAALAIYVFISVPLFGIARKGVGGYLKQYIQTTAAGYRPHTVHLLPIDAQWLDRHRQHAWDSKSLPMFTMDPDQLLSSLIQEYLFITIFRAYVESLASENAARLAAMQGAQTNIEELMDDLESRYNQLRQMSITEELLDIVSGFEALDPKKSRDT